MGRLREKRPSPALVVAIVALIAALAGTAIAQEATTSAKPVTKKKAKKIAKKQANKAVDNLLPIGGTDLGDIREESQTFQVNAATTVDQRVDCDSDERVISGGSRWDNFPGTAFVGITQVDRREENGWRAGGRNFTAATQPFTVYAYCLEP